MDKEFINTGGIFACPNDPESEESCYLDWGQSFGMGVSGRSPATILGCESDKWCVLYACRKKVFGFKNEWVWIYSREPELSKEDKKAAMASIKEFLPDFEEDRLVAVKQGEKNCKYPEMGQQANKEDESQEDIKDPKKVDDQIDKDESKEEVEDPEKDGKIPKKIDEQEWDGLIVCWPN